MNKKLKGLLVEREKLHEECRAILDKAEKEERGLTDEENKEFNKKIAKIRQLNIDISEEEDKERREWRANTDMTGGGICISHSDQAPAPRSYENCRIYGKGQRVSDFYRMENDERLDLGKYVRGALSGNWDRAAREKEVFAALSTGTGKVLIPAPLSAEVIDLARNKSVLFNSGVPLVEMQTNNLTMAKVASDPQFGFKEELAEIEPVDMTFEGVELRAKTAYGLMQISLELLHSADNLEEVLRGSMAASIANTIDQKCLFGSGGVEPKGVLTHDTINVIEVTESLTSYSPFVRAVGAIRKKNGEPNSFVVNATIDEKLNDLTDTTGQPLNPPKVLEGLQRQVSNQLPADNGAGEDESIAMIYDSKAMAIGMQVPIIIQASDSAHDAYTKGAVYIRVYSMLDICLLQPEHVTMITGLK